MMFFFGLSRGESTANLAVILTATRHASPPPPPPPPRTHQAVRALVQAGANTSSENSKGQTPFDLASTAEVKAALAGEPAPTATLPASGGTVGGGGDAPGGTPGGVPGDTAVQQRGNGAPTEGEAVAVAGVGEAAAAARRGGVPAGGTKEGGAEQEGGTKQGGGAKDREEEKKKPGDGGRGDAAPGSGRAPEGVAVGMIEAGDAPGGVSPVPDTGGTGNGNGGASEGRRKVGAGVAMEGGVSADGGAGKVGSLAERRRKRRKRAQEQAAGQMGGGGGG